MINDFAKEYLHEDLRWVRQSVLDKLEGLSEYDVWRPLTRTGTNLLGLVKHLTLSEVVYLGDVFERPFPQRHLRFDDPDYRNRDSLWVSDQESHGDIVRGYRRAWQHADATIGALPIDAGGRVPWWPQPEVKLFNVMVHVLTETNRHAGHADILHEQLKDAIDLPASSSTTGRRTGRGSRRRPVSPVTTSDGPRTESANEVSRSGSLAGRLERRCPRPGGLTPFGRLVISRTGLHYPLGRRHARAALSVAA